MDEIAMGRVTVHCLLILTAAVSGLLASEANRKCRTPWSDCGSGSLVVNAVDVPGCCSAACVLIKGRNVTVSLTVTPTESVTSMSQQLCGVVTGSYCVPVLLPSSDACKTIPCPLEPGNRYTFNLTLPVQSSYPTIQLNVKWRLFSSGSEIACIELPVAVISIVDSKSPKYTPECKPPVLAHPGPPTAADVIRQIAGGRPFAKTTVNRH